MKNPKKSASEVVKPSSSLNKLVGLFNLYSNYTTDPWWSETPEKMDFAYNCLKLTKQYLLEYYNIDISIYVKDTVIEYDQNYKIQYSPEKNEFGILKNGYNLEYDLKSSGDVKDFVKDDDKAVDLYRALCNVTWYKAVFSWDCSWRYAGGVVSEIRNELNKNKSEDYLSYYCSGGEGSVSAEVSYLLEILGWTHGVDD